MNMLWPWNSDILILGWIYLYFSFCVDAFFLKKKHNCNNTETNIAA